MDPQEKICANCVYFHLHYIKVGDEYIPVSLGHCSKPRLKQRQVELPGCLHWEPRSPEAPQEEHPLF